MPSAALVLRNDKNTYTYMIVFPHRKFGLHELTKDPFNWRKLRKLCMDKIISDKLVIDAHTHTHTHTHGEQCAVAKTGLG